MHQTLKYLLLANDARSVLSLSCHCPLSKRGCNWRGNLGNCVNHLDTCGYVYEECSLKCGVVLSRDELRNHVNEICNQRKIQCEHCSKYFKVCEMTKHLDKCPKMKLECELGCGVVMCREGMAQHVEQDCVEKKIMCPFVKYQCVEPIKRKHLNQHLEEKETKHLELKLTAMETVIEAQRQDIQKQETEMLQQRTEMQNNFYDIIATTKIQWNVRTITVQQLKTNNGWATCGYYPPSGCFMYIDLRSATFYLRFPCRNDYGYNNPYYRYTASGVNAKFVVLLNLPTNPPTTKVYARKLKVWKVNVLRGCTRILFDIPQADITEFARIENNTNRVANQVEVNILVIPE